MTALQFIKYSGASGGLCIFLGMVLSLAGLVMFALSKRREPFVFVVGGAAAIFLIGLFGSVWGALGAFNTIATSPTAPTPAEVSGGVVQCLCSLAISIPLALLVGFVGVIGLAVKPSDAAYLASLEENELQGR